MLKHTFKKMFLVIAMSVFTFNVHAADWTMASGYPKSNFHTQNIMKFIDEVKANTSVNINLNENDTLIKIDAIKTSLQRGQIPIGEIRFNFIDLREDSQNFNERMEINLSVKNYVRLTVPPSIWFGFKGLADQNMLVNIASIPHDPKEVSEKNKMELEFN